MSTQKADLASVLRRAIDSAGLSVDELAVSTKIPRSTIRSFLKEPISAILPERVYLIGHLSVLAQELRLDVQEMVAIYDRENPIPTTTDLVPPKRPNPTKIALAAGLGGIAIFMIVLIVVS